MQWKTLTASTIFSLLITSSLHAADDWRKSSNNQDKINNLVELVPGTAHWMAEMGDRYRNLYWAGQHEMWDFAIYQAEEIEKLIEIVGHARPKRAKSAEIFKNNVFPALHEAWQGHLRSAVLLGVLRANGDVRVPDPR